MKTQAATFPSSARGPRATSVFVRRVLAVVSRIPSGRVATYGDVAAAAGFDGAARAVGTVMRICGRPDLPCHRVVAAGGRLGGYGGNAALKRELLRHEGVAIAGTRIRDFAERRWPAPGRGKPGAALRRPAVSKLDARSEPMVRARARR